MKLKLIWILTFFVLFGINLIFSTTPCDLDETACEDEKPDYNDPLYYENTNPSEWDKDKVNWDLVPDWMINAVPSETLDIPKLSEEQIGALVPKQVGDKIEDIENLEKVDSMVASIAVQEEFGAAIDFDSVEEGVEPSINEGKLETASDDSLTLGEEGGLSAENSLITFNEEGELEVIIDQDDEGEEELEGNETLGDTSSIAISQEDSFNLDTTFQSTSFDINGNEIELSGKFRVENGEVYVLPEFSEYGDVMVNGVVIQNFEGEKLKLSFDPEATGEPGVLTVNDYVLDYESGGGVNGLVLTFDEDGGRKYFEGDTAPILEIGSDVETLSLTSRADDGLVPVMDVSISEDASLDTGLWISNGPMRVVVSDETLVIPNTGAQPFSLDSGSENAFLERDISTGELSSPMRVEVSRNGGSIDSYLMSGYNEIFSFGDNMGEPIDEGTMALRGYQTSYSETSSFNGGFSNDMILERFGIDVPTISIRGEDVRYEPSEVALKRTYDILSNLPSNIVGSIDQVQMMPDTLWTRLRPDEEGFKEGGFVGVENPRVLAIRESESGTLFPDSTFYHEATHSWDFAKMDDPLTGSDILYQKTQVGDSSELEWDSTGGLDFNFEWSLIHGEKYGTSSSGVDWNEGYSSEFSVMDSLSGAGNGCFRAYGCSKIEEDVVTSIEKVFEDPSFYDQLINPSVDDRRYIQKLALANEYGLIPPTWFETRMRATGWDEGCIQDVTANEYGYQSECIQ